MAPARRWLALARRRVPWKGCGAGADGVVGEAEAWGSGDAEELVLSMAPPKE